MSIQEYFQLRTASASATACAEARTEEVARNLWTNSWDDSVREHPDVLVLKAEATRLYWEADALTPHVIRANLQAFGLEDLEVVGVLTDRDSGQEIGRSEPVALSELCGLRYRRLAKKLGLDPQQAGFEITILGDRIVIGRIDSDGDFDYEAAPNLRTALGWKIATDGGRERLIEFFDLDRAARSLLDTIRANGTEREAFFGPYFDALKRVFVYERTSRFADGYCGAADPLWRAATRELGQEHEGYPFCY